MARFWCNTYKTSAMKVFVTALFCLPFIVFGQSREFYMGSNFSNYYWFNENADLNSNTYLQGAQLGFRWGKKEQNIFQNQKLFQVKLGVEYNFAQLDQAASDREPEALISGKQVHSLRVSAPVRLMFNRKKKLNFFAQGEPGINMSVYQGGDRTSEINDRIPPLDIYLNAGVGMKINTLKDSYNKPGMKFSGVTIAATKYFSLDPFRTNATKVGVLDQYMLNVGMSFSYYKPGLRDRLNVFGNK